MKTRLRWMFLSNMYPSSADPSYGAFVARSLEDLRAQDLDIRQVVVIHGRHAGWEKLRMYLSYFRRLLVAGCFGGVDAVYTHYASHHCVPIALLKVVLRKRLVLHIHGDDLAVRAGWSRTLNRTGQAWLVKHADLIVVPSQYFAELLQSIYPHVRPDRICVSPSSGVDVTAFARHDAVANPGHWQSTLSASQLNVGYVGRIDADKGWYLLTRAWEQLPDALRAKTHLHFWGGGQDLPLLQQQIERVGASNATYHGHVAPEEVPGAHRHFDFHVVPSFRESLGLSAVEGMAAGHLVLCSAIRPLTDFTIDGQHALHFQVGDELALRDALVRASCLSADELATISAAARHLSLTFNRPVIAARLATTIKETVCRS